MIYPMILKKRQILQTLRGFYIHGQGQILMTLSALMYEPHLILYSDILSGILFVSHIESRFYTLAYMFIAVLPWANRSVGDRWQPLLNSTLGSRQTCTLVGHVLVVPVGFGWPGGLPDVLRLHVPHVRVAEEHARFSLAVQSRSIGVCRRGCPDRVMDRAQPVFLSVCDYYLFALYIFAPIVVY